jgi:hypothetical protein
MPETRQVGIATDHFECQAYSGAGAAIASGTVMQRIRHCVECPKCLTRYIISCTPYRNGSYLVPTIQGSLEEYTLYCSCSRGTGVSRWRSSEAKPCEVSKEAYDRGYGTPDEITVVKAEPQEPWSVDVSRYLRDWKSLDKRRSLH